MKCNSSWFISVIVIGLLLTLNSCLTYKQIVNFQDGEDLADGRIDSIANKAVVRIQPDDVIAIFVSSYEREEASRFNIFEVEAQMQASRGTGSGTVSEPYGYRVDSKGDIYMPILGQINVKGLTIEEVTNLISGKVAQTGYLKDHSVQVRFLTFRITILGEVNVPGVYTIPNNKITVLEAVGLANDLTVFSNRDNILIIREENNKRTYGRVDLKTKEVFKSPFYYLQPNDIVYVEPHKSRILATPDPVTRYVGTFIALATLITLIIALFR
jgi:polysaccharide export outer membrane protein